MPVRSAAGGGVARRGGRCRQRLACAALRRHEWRRGSGWRPRSHGPLSCWRRSDGPPRAALQACGQLFAALGARRRPHAGCGAV